MIAELAKQANDLQTVVAEATKAQHLPKTDYDAKKKQELEQIARAAKQETQVELPKVEFEAGSREYFQKLEEILQQFKAQIGVHEVRLDAHDIRLDIIEERLDLLEGRVLGLEDSLGMIRAASERLEQEISAAGSSSAQVQQLLAQQVKLKEREGHIKAFNRNADQRHYFYALLSEMESAYLAAQVMKSGKLQQEKSEKYGKAAGYAGKIISLIPVIGQAASTLVSGVAYALDLKSCVKEQNAFMRIRNLAPSVVEFDQIAIRVAVESTLRNQEVLGKLNGAEVPRDWKTKLKALKDGLEGLMTEFLKDNETQAKVLGRLDAYKVIAHLQEEAVAENYSTEEGNEGRGRHSVIGQQIISAVHG